jgi:hypothetical protein
MFGLAANAIVTENSSVTTTSPKLLNCFITE